jgi:hypothetical protein
LVTDYEWKVKGKEVWLIPKPLNQTEGEQRKRSGSNLRDVNECRVSMVSVSCLRGSYRGVLATAITEYPRLGDL